MTATVTMSLREQAESAYAAAQREQRERDARERAEQVARVTRETRLLIASTLGVDYENVDLDVAEGGWDRARFSIDEIPFCAAHRESEYTSGWHLYVESPCTRKGCTQQDVPALIEIFALDDVGSALHKEAQHEWSMHCVDQSSVPWISPEERALADAATRCAIAHNEVAALEDARAIVKAMCIKAMIGTLNEVTGKPHSASSAEAVVEAHPDYMAHRDKQRAAEVERWTALGEWEAAKYGARCAQEAKHD